MSQTRFSRRGDGEVRRMDASPVDAIARQLVEVDRELAIDLTAYLHSARLIEDTRSPMGSRLRSFQLALRRALASAGRSDAA
jgi:hypothetical protein